MCVYIYRNCNKFIFSDTSSPTTSTPATDAVHMLEIAQLPVRFQRAMLDDNEINAINVSISKLKLYFSFCLSTYKFVFQSGGAE